MTPTTEAIQVDVGKCLLYAGSYTDDRGEGIYVYESDFITGSTELIEVYRDIENPSYMSFNERGDRLYAVNEVSEFEGEATGSVCAFAVDPGNGGLSFLNQKASHGNGPCYVSLSSSGKNVLVSNYKGGGIAVFSIGANGEVGELTEIKQHYQTGFHTSRQASPHPHSIITSPGDDYVLVPDLGSDKVFIYETRWQDDELKLKNTGAIDCKAGAGPRHVVFHPDENFIYVVNELDATIAAFKYEPKGKNFKNIQIISTIPPDFTVSNAPAEVKIHPSGKFLFTSNRGHDSIAIFNLDKNDGKLSSLGHEFTRGRIPRNFGFDPTGHFLLAANRKSDNVTVFAIDEQTGSLQFTGQEIDVPEPACIKTKRITCHPMGEKSY